MDSPETAPEHDENRTNEKTDNGDITIAELETLATPEQVLSASVARKRRNIIKRRSISSNRTRDPTPIRSLTDVPSSSEDGQPPRPKTPERRRKKSSGLPLEATVKKVEGADGRNEVKENNERNFKINQMKEVIPIPNDVEKLTKKESLVNISQAELLAMFDKAKQKIKSSREKYKNKQTLKRSQSAPRQLTDEQLMESFKRAQLASAEREQQRKRSSSARKYSTDSMRSTSSSEQIPKFIDKPKTTTAQTSSMKAAIPSQPINALGKKRDPRSACNKIIEILDPKTSRVIKRKEIIHIKFRFFEFLKLLKLFTIKEIILEYRKFKIDMKREHIRILDLRRKCINELLLLMVLCGLGGVMFKFVEGAFENFYKCGVKRIKRDFIDQLWLKSHNLREEDWKSLARNKLKMFEEELHTAHEAGIRSYTGKTSWSFFNGVLYSLTLITTIGYGHMFPTTFTGKGLTILYALIGIPLFLIIMTDFGKLFTRCIKFVWSFVRRLYYTGRCRAVRKATHTEDIFKGAQIVYDIATLRRPSMFGDHDPNVEEGKEEPEDGGTSPATPAPSNYEIDDEFNLPITLALSILVIYILLGAVAFQILENWDFFSSFYFVFISLSTIGLGDFVPSNNIFMILSIIYLIFGLALMSMCINVVQDKLSDTFKQASAKLGATIGFTVNDEDGSIATVPPEPIEMPEVHNAENQDKDRTSITEVR